MYLGSEYWYSDTPNKEKKQLVAEIDGDDSGLNHQTPDNMELGLVQRRYEIEKSKHI